MAATRFSSFRVTPEPYLLELSMVDSMKETSLNNYFYAWFHSYHYDSDDKWVVLTKEEFDLLLPYEHALSMGNYSDTPYENFIVEQIMERDDADLRPSEINHIKSNRIIEVALC